MTKGTDSAVLRFTDWVIRFRWFVVVVSIVSILSLATGARHLELEQNYRIFFSPENPQLVAFDNLEAMYTKIDTHQFLVHNASGTVVYEEALLAVRELTNAGWQIPFSTRVDSLVNHQHSWAIEDDLLVEDLVPEEREGDAEIVARAMRVAAEEPLVAGGIINSDLDTTVVTVRIHLDDADPLAVRTAAAHSRGLLEDIRAKYPDLRFELTGTGMLSNAFGESPEVDGTTVFPAMFLLLILFLYLFTHSITGTVATLTLVVLSAMGAMGASGYYGYGLNPANLVAPVVILTLAVADSIHILLTMFKEMSNGSDKQSAIRESMRINAQPVFLTSLTTAIGFLVMNFSDAPPFWELGNVTATGVGLAWLLSITFLPAMLTILPVRPGKRSNMGQRAMRSIAELNIRHRKKLVTVVGGCILFFIASISRMEIDDVPHRYFKDRYDFRTATDFYDDELGFYGFFMSIDSGEEGGINEPGYLASLSHLGEWLREQPGVTSVVSYADISSRLNMNMHGDDETYRRIPESRELAAQYLLLYEMSLPFGLDLNDQINVDKSATRIAANFRKTSLAELARAGKRAETWIEEEGEGLRTDGATSPPIMFESITRTNIHGMIRGTALGFVLIAIVLIVSLRSWTMGILSLVPNIVPAATAFGIWALVVGKADFAISVVGGLSIGIIVDDTVHFLSKYSRARREMHLSAEEAVRYAFSTVGQALLSTSFIVAGGFAVLMLSSFRVTVYMGAITSLTVVCALVADFFMLPALLLILDRRDMGAPLPEAEQN